MTKVRKELVSKHLDCHCTRGDKEYIESDLDDGPDDGDNSRLQDNIKDAMTKEPMVLKELLLPATTNMKITRLHQQTRQMRFTLK